MPKTKITKKVNRMASIPIIKKKKDGQKLMQLGDRNTFISVQQWKKNTLVHIRRYVAPKDSYSSSDEGGSTTSRDFFPTRKGIALNVKEYRALMNGKDTIEAWIERCEKKSETDEEEEEAEEGEEVKEESPQKKKKK